jgi:hypothetical protein
LCQSELSGRHKSRVGFQRKLRDPRGAGLQDLHRRPSDLTDHLHIHEMPIKE